MGMQLAGTQLLVPTDEVISWCYNNIDPSQVALWGHRAYLGPYYSKITIATTYRPPKRAVVGSFDWPGSASAWASGFFLADSDMVNEISSVAWSGGIQSAVTLKLDSEVKDNKSSSQTTYEVFSTSVYVLPPVPMSSLDGGETFDEATGLPVNNLYMLCVVDKRYYWWYMNTGDISIPPEGADWQDLFDDIGSVIGSTISVSKISDDYGKAHPSLSVSYEVLPPFMDAVAANVGHRIFVDPKTQEVYSQSADDAKKTREAEENRWPARTTIAGNYKFQDVY